MDFKNNKILIIAFAVALLLVAYFAFNSGLFFSGTGNIRNCIARISIGGSSAKAPDCSDNDGKIKKTYINDLYLGEIESVPIECWANPSSNPSCQKHIKGIR
ncbi:hypothetical protein COU49_00935 [Candidatus Nomurabacteria bacterium CG10_big_fil_rev_8_21_14_0_10_35_16]|uniref:Uncharacterized protein n=1 Tax=Candidatus Nomurabacteria bacterium CG10_big_fil_rev_8_21_14_0_10_35_16 TaxID=1974731 RepID=A0A2H0TBM7_9BACT|nr:MAG: hypothetical protein COU49_00935 [Candidatus Nomurabacteria bacterium CG10_big_fil_rev_8_21_14_0_10_35_16]